MEPRRPPAARDHPFPVLNGQEKTSKNDELRTVITKANLSHCVVRHLPEQCCSYLDYSSTAPSLYTSLYRPQTLRHRHRHRTHRHRTHRHSHYPTFTDSTTSELLLQCLLQSNNEVEMAVRKRLRYKEEGSCRDRTAELLPR